MTPSHSRILAAPSETAHDVVKIADEGDWLGYDRGDFIVFNHDGKGGAIVVRTGNSRFSTTSLSMGLFKVTPADGDKWYDLLSV